MTNKEINMAILNKLYEIAEMIWQKMVKDNHGSYRASEISPLPWVRKTAKSPTPPSRFQM